jgi:hypothetical protein
MNDATSQQSSTATPIVKRRPGRPRGSKNRPVKTTNTISEPATVEVGIDTVTAMAKKAYRTLPDIKMPEGEFAEEFRKTYKNISIRPIEEHTKWLIYFEHKCGFAKADLIKECMLRSLLIICDERSKALAEGVRVATKDLAFVQPSSF